MDVLKNILEITPDTWMKNFTYDDKRYILFDLEEESQEYKDVLCNFGNKFIYTGTPVIQRVEHLYAFARYKWHKENTEKNSEEFIYVNEKETNLSTYLDTICDPRLKSDIEHSNIFIRIMEVKGNCFEKRDSCCFPEYIIKLTQHKYEWILSDLKDGEEYQDVANHFGNKFIYTGTLSIQKIQHLSSYEKNINQEEEITYINAYETCLYDYLDNCDLKLCSSINHSNIFIYILIIKDISSDVDVSQCFPRYIIKVQPQFDNDDINQPQINP